PLVLAGDPVGPGEIENGRTRRAEESALVTGREKAGTPVEGTTFDALVVAQHDVAREILAFASEPVSDPGAGAARSRTRNPSIDLIGRRHVIVRFGIERFDEGKIIHMFRDVRILFTHPRAGLAVSPELKRRFHQRPRVSVEHIDLDALSVAPGQL